MTNSRTYANSYHIPFNKNKNGLYKYWNISPRKSGPYIFLKDFVTKTHLENSIFRLRVAKLTIHRRPKPLKKYNKDGT